MRSFQYLKPTTMKQALDALDEYRDQARLIAGGTDLMVQWKKRAINPKALISLRNIPELHFIENNGDLVIGAGTTHRSIELSDSIRRKYPVLTDAVDNLGSIQVRNSATIGGNICNAAPSADTAPPLLVLEAMVNLVGPDGERSIPISEFFGGPSRTALAQGEIVTDFSIKGPGSNTGAAYWKHTKRKAMDLPILGVACLISFDESMKICNKVRIALGVAAPTPIRVPGAEEYLRGKEITPETLEEAGRIASEEASPRTTIRGAEWYRRRLIKTLVGRVARICLARAKGGRV
jgi:carbon-monoxide dehydrogenase medium subunit